MTRLLHAVDVFTEQRSADIAEEVCFLFFLVDQVILSALQSHNQAEAAFPISIDIC